MIFGWFDMISRERVKQMFTHYRKRLKKYGLKEEDGNVHAFRTTGKPCSCFACRGEKYSRKTKHKNKMKKDFEAL
jgi:hypothetical protein